MVIKNQLRKLIFLCFLSVLTFCSWPVFAEMSAGIVLYLKTNTETYLLLADHSSISQQKRGWGGFGGRPDRGETPAETAARETEEETRGFFKKEFLIEKLKNITPVIDDGFAQFFVEIDFIPAQRIANNMEPGADLSHYERCPYAWIPFSDIEKYLKEKIDRETTYNIDSVYLPPECHSRHYWPSWLSSMKKAFDRDSLPWSRIQSPE